MTQVVRLLVVNACLPTLLVGAAFFTVGCGDGGGDKQVVAPPTPPEQASKDSMDYYKSQMSKSGKKR